MNSYEEAFGYHIAPRLTSYEEAFGYHLETAKAPRITAIVRKLFKTR